MRAVYETPEACYAASLIATAYGPGQFNTCAGATEVEEEFIATHIAQQMGILPEPSE